MSLLFAGHGEALGMKGLSVSSLHWEKQQSILWGRVQGVGVFNCYRQDNKYRLGCRLPGLKPLLGNYPTELEAMQIAEAAYSGWLDKMNLTERRSNQNVA